MKLPGQDADGPRGADETRPPGAAAPPRRRAAAAAGRQAAADGPVRAGRDGPHRLARPRRLPRQRRRHVDLLDCVYYATVTLSTTGYGDIVPYSDSARLINVLLITPLRVLFLIILVGTTLEVLTERTREEWRLNRWRTTLRDHTVVVGFGTKGRSAVQTAAVPPG